MKEIKGSASQMCIAVSNERHASRSFAEDDGVSAFKIQLVRV